MVALLDFLFDEDLALVLLVLRCGVALRCTLRCEVAFLALVLLDVVALF